MKTRVQSRSTRGSATIVVLALLAIVVMLAAANLATTNWLRSEVKLIDQRQTARLAASVTNSISNPASPAP